MPENIERTSNMFRGEEHPAHYSFRKEYMNGPEPDEATIVGGAILLLAHDNNIQFLLVWSQGEVITMSQFKYDEKYGSPNSDSSVQKKGKRKKSKPKDTPKHKHTHSRKERRGRNLGRQ